jgi:hypothetical protein
MFFFWNLLTSWYQFKNLKPDSINKSLTYKSVNFKQFSSIKYVHFDFDFHLHFHLFAHSLFRSQSFDAIIISRPDPSRDYLVMKRFNSTIFSSRKFLSFLMLSWVGHILVLYPYYNLITSIKISSLNVSQIR